MAWVTLTRAELTTVCACGEALTGRSRVWCAQCVVKNHPGSSQCAFCKEWYYTHSGNVRQSVLEFHAKKHCKRT